MLPWKLLFLRSKIEILVEFARQCGITPFKLLLDNSRYIIELKLQNEEGMVPVMLLSEIIKNNSDGGGAGSSP